MNARGILARNVRALMAKNESLNSHAKLARRCSTPTRRVGARTIGHLLDPNSTVQPQLDTVNAIADAFGVSASALLSPDFDASAKTVAPSKTLALAQRLQRLKPDRLELLFEVLDAVTPIADEARIPGTLRVPQRGARKRRRA